MITMQSKVSVDGIRGLELFDFLMNPSDGAYQKWWPGIHLEFHYLRRNPNDIGSIVCMDEWVGKRRLRMAAVVEEVEPGKKIVWQLWKGIRTPIRLTLEFLDNTSGVTLVHTIHAGFKGMGKIFDPFFRIYFSSEFEKDMDEHARTEFPRLGEMLASEKLTA